MAATVVSFINLKGGVGKSMLALVIGETLAFLRRRHRVSLPGGQVQEALRGPERVLLVDIDLQSNLSYATTSRQRMADLEYSGHIVYDMFAAALQGKPWDVRAAINKNCSNIAGNTHLHNLVCTPALGCD